MKRKMKLLLMLDRIYLMEIMIRCSAMCVAEDICFFTVV